MKKIIQTKKAPAAIGTYSQAVQVGDLVFISGQIPLNPETMEIEVTFPEQVERVFKNLQAICEAAGGSLENIVKINIYLTDLTNFSKLNEIMKQYFSEPYPARAAVGVSELPRGVAIEMEAILSLR